MGSQHSIEMKYFYPAMGGNPIPFVRRRHSGGHWIPYYQYWLMAQNRMYHPMNAPMITHPDMVDPAGGNATYSPYNNAYPRHNSISYSTNGYF
jgi:hypothetical protein